MYGIKCWISLHCEQINQIKQFGILIKDSQKLNFAISGQQFLAWAFSDQKPDGEEEILEDAKTRKRRLNVELAKALAVLNIKPSTFHSFHYGGKKDKVKKLLEQALIARTKGQGL